jgi:hypothetical protein
MPVKTIIGADGQPHSVRAKFDARDYTAPPGFISKLKANFHDYGSRELLGEYDGPFMGMPRAGEVERDGRHFMRLLANAGEWAIDVELTDYELGEVLPVPPEEAWKIMRGYDAKGRTPIDVEDG